ncbi:predicted protein [Histoplasma capsulatum var. duboisii H88]|uniref:Predicted protein n=1 Tax=Ajellomyces capsulatus (strain H88) TaxID=544711 RepID=F0U8T5_AJEC8|nr:predicted protein [Histoplasma capsulatum var. duboisii H88]
MGIINVVESLVVVWWMKVRCCADCGTVNLVLGASLAILAATRLTNHQSSVIRTISKDLSPERCCSLQTRHQKGQQQTSRDEAGFNVSFKLDINHEKIASCPIFHINSSATGREGDV